MSTRRSAIDSDPPLLEVLPVTAAMSRVEASVFAFFGPPPFFLAKTFAGNLSNGVSFVKNNRVALAETVPPHFIPKRANSDLSSSPLTPLSNSSEVEYLLRSIPTVLSKDAPSDGVCLSVTMLASATRHSHPSTPPVSPHSFSKDATALAITSISTFKNGDVRFRNPVRYVSNSRKNRAYLRRSRNFADSEMEVFRPLESIERKSR
mmetsp:Transcript_10016/g.16112  ORF Transcript_10016/g.16112 Transcript_10016/m.16112 type:complete len:206 (-) Transcript_10016:18-635(-)